MLCFLRVASDRPLEGLGSAKDPDERALVSIFGNRSRDLMFAGPQHPSVLRPSKIVPEKREFVGATVIPRPKHPRRSP
jgi:hypothetical protein